MSGWPAPTVDPTEVAKFSAISEEWWEPDGRFRPLHRFNPVRLALIRFTAAKHFGRDAKSLRPFEGLKLLDIGCGGGLLAEPLARMGFSVVGIDASERNIGVAVAHSAGGHLPLTYRAVTPETLLVEGETFDLVLNMEVIEHVPDIAVFLEASANLVASRGLMLVGTINRTLKSLILAKLGAEYVLRWLPPGTHDWNRFVPPATLRAMLTSCGLTVAQVQGITFNVLRWEWALSRDTDVNYIAVAQRA